MTPKKRLLAAIEGKVPDRLPVTTHHVMPYFLNKYMGGISNDDFFNHFGFDPIHWTNPVRGYGVPGANQGPIETGTSRWRFEQEKIPDPRYATTRHFIHTSKGVLSLTLQSNNQTSWLVEHLVKEKRDIDLIGEFAPIQKCDVEAVNRDAEKYGNGALIRGHIQCFDLYGQPGCWQDACCLVGTEKLILATYDDPDWVHQLLRILLERKKGFIESLEGARFDILELGGGDASTTVISPKVFETFVAPYDSQLIDLAHRVGQRIVYHTCGGMMPILERLADMGPDALETFTPRKMGADVDLADAKRRIGDRVCMIGGFDQFHFFQDCSPQQTKAEVRRCFEEAGGGGGYILCPSDHFFDADVELLEAFADEAHACVYGK